MLSGFRDERNQLSRSEANLAVFFASFRILGWIGGPVTLGRWRGVTGDQHFFLTQLLEARGVIGNENVF